MTLGFHIIFATIGVGVPMIIALAQWIGIRHNDGHYLLLARRWARGFTITVAVGVVTGTAIGFQLHLLWPSFMAVAGQAIALPLFMETFAFFFEAIFLGIYLYTWDRFRNRMVHFWLFVPVIIGSSASALFITTVNAFMNTPQGFTLVDGVMTDVQPLAAMFNPATPTKVAHVLSSAYMTASFVLAAIAAWGLLRRNTAAADRVYYHKALRLTMLTGLVFALATAVIGDLSGKFLAKYQPIKLAAAEWHFETTDKAPLVFGGILDEDRTVRYGITIPYALSILAHGDINAPVQGLNDFPANEHPPLWIHYLFDAMVAIGMFCLLLCIAYWIVRRFAHTTPRPLLWLIWLSGPLAMIAIECGWIFTEVGRQPWILWGIMKTAEGATTSAHVKPMLLVFGCLYVVLAITCATVLRSMFRGDRPSDELAVRGWNDGVHP
jgi:cytochrome d ubiquinol oxidase subunit I